MSFSCIASTGCAVVNALDTTEPVMAPRKSLAQSKTPYKMQTKSRTTADLLPASKPATPTIASPAPTVSPEVVNSAPTTFKPAATAEPALIVTPPAPKPVVEPALVTPQPAPVAVAKAPETAAPERVIMSPPVDLDPQPRPRNPLARATPEEDGVFSPVQLSQPTSPDTASIKSPVETAPAPVAVAPTSVPVPEPVPAPVPASEPGPIQAAPYSPAPQAIVAPPAKPVDPEQQKVRDRLAQVRGELEKGRDVNDKDDNGRTLLQQAALAGEQATVELLLDWGANVKAVDRQGWTALHWAASSGHQEICELLIACGTPIDSRGFLDETPLYWASVFDRQQTVELLLARGAKVNAADKRGKTPLHAAVEGDARATATILIAQGAEVTAKDEAGLTPLHQVVFRLRKTLLGLADETPDATAQISGVTSAEASLERDQQRKLAITAAREMARLLISKGADVNAATPAGVTPLHLAAWDDTREIADLLIADGAKASAKDSRGRTAGDYAKQRGQKLVMPILSAKAR